MATFQGGSVFQSTLPTRGATQRGRREATPIIISIHAPHAGSDRPLCCSQDDTVHFNPRSPRGERHDEDLDISTLVRISIHAPHAGSDDAQPYQWSRGGNFNPRSPRGERRGVLHQLPAVCRFQSTLPTRGATKLPQVPVILRRISIHAPHAGSDGSYARNSSRPS